MQFNVPQFTEQETKIAGPLTFKQFVMVAIAIGIVMLLYLFLAKDNFFLFLVSSGAILTTIFSLAFLKVGGRSLPTVLGHSFGFFLSPRLYLWRKKELPPRIVWKKVSEEKFVKPKTLNPDLRIAEKSRINRMATAIDTKK